jgi:hypothetical protein
MKFRSLFIILITYFTIFSCQGQKTSKNIVNIDPEAFSNKIKETPKAQIKYKLVRR